MLSLNQGLAYLALAEQHEGRGYQRKAADVLGRIDRAQAAVSDRVRYEIANHQAAPQCCSMTWTPSSSTFTVASTGSSCSAASNACEKHSKRGT